MIGFPKRKDTPANRKWREALKEGKQAKGNKLHAERSICSRGHPHPSKLECAVCEILILREKSGDIRNLKWQATVELDYQVRWKIDWSFEQSPDWHLRFAEAKGKEDRDFKLKFRMWCNGCAKGPLELWRGNHRRPYLDIVIMP